MERAELERELRMHHEASFGWAVGCCDGDRARAEDVLHECYLRVLDGRALPRRYHRGLRRTGIESRSRRAPA